MTTQAGQQIGLPVRPFMYTLDQIATMLDIKQETLKKWLFYEGRSVGVCPKDKIPVRNIAPDGLKPEWRCSERSFISWMRFKGFRYHERGYIR